MKELENNWIEKWEYDTPFPALANLTSLRLHVDICLLYTSRCV